MTDVTLFNIPPSLCSQKARLALVEKGVDFTNRWVDIGPTAENYEPWYVKLNPKCVVPTLTHGDRVVTDSAVIMRYAAEQFEGAELIPLDPETLARMEYWYGLGDSLDFRLFSFSNMPKKLTDFGLDKKIGKLRKYAEKYPELRAEYQAKLLDIQGLKTAKSDLASVAEGARKLETALDEMNLALETRPFVAGDRYTLADVIWTVALTRIEALERIELVEARPNVLGYYRRMQERPSYRKADLWPRINVLTLLPFIVRVMGPRLVKPLLVVIGIAVLVWWLSRA